MQYRVLLLLDAYRCIQKSQANRQTKDTNQYRKHAIIFAQACHYNFCKWRARIVFAAFYFFPGYNGVPPMIEEASSSSSSAIDDVESETSKAAEYSVHQVSGGSIGIAQNYGSGGIVGNQIYNSNILI